MWASVYRRYPKQLDDNKARSDPLLSNWPRQIKNSQSNVGNRALSALLLSSAWCYWLLRSIQEHVYWIYLNHVYVPHDENEFGTVIRLFPSIQYFAPLTHSFMLSFNGRFVLKNLSLDRLRYTKHDGTILYQVSLLPSSMLTWLILSPNPGTKPEIM